MKISLTSLITCMLFVMSCKCSKDNEKAVEPTQGRLMDVNTYAKLEFGEDHTIVHNSLEDYVLIYQMIKNRPNAVYSTVRYHILELKSMELVYQDNVPRAEISWIEDYVVEIKAEKGIPGPDGQEAKDPSYKYHVKNRKKFSGGLFGKKQGN